MRGVPTLHEAARQEQEFALLDECCIPLHLTKPALSRQDTALCYNSYWWAAANAVRLVNLIDANNDYQCLSEEQEAVCRGCGKTQHVRVVVSVLLARPADTRCLKHNCPCIASAGEWLDMKMCISSRRCLPAESCAMLSLQKGALACCCLRTKVSGHNLQRQECAVLTCDPLGRGGTASLF